MNKGSEFGARKKILWAAEALGLVLAYFGAFALLMYPVVDSMKVLA